MNLGGGVEGKGGGNCKLTNFLYCLHTELAGNHEYCFEYFVNEKSKKMKDARSLTFPFIDVG